MDNGLKILLDTYWSSDGWKLDCQIPKEDISNAFLYSLSTRKLEYRSALGSYWYAISIPKHELYIGDGQTKNKHCYFYKRHNNTSEKGYL